MKPKPWDRKWWGVSYLPTGSRNSPYLIETSWSDRRSKIHAVCPSEPLRPLLFITRRECRAWISKQKEAQVWEAACYRCIRVREIVEVCDD